MAKRKTVCVKSSKRNERNTRPNASKSRSFNKAKEFDDEDEVDEDDGDDSELPDIFSSYNGWNVWIEKDPVHKFIVTATLDSENEIEIDRIEIYGDEIDEGADIETIVAEKIDERDEERASMEDWNRHYGSYMGLSEDPDWFDSYAPD
ncbi:hypothetical protein [Treponema zioleckii]|uniref:hypothetical protein n=1 Tax=Treponema zioleckii TaxID=331680 RepID=UPI00168B8B24|nr:hypothetical protein [Treponema zioleckii]